MNAASVGLNLVACRRAAGLTQSALAGRMGTSQSVIARAETDWSRAPTLGFIDRYARACGRTVTLTLGGDDDPEAWAARRRVVLGEVRFDPFERSPSPAEVRSLARDGIVSGAASAR